MVRPCAAICALLLSLLLPASLAFPLCTDASQFTHFPTPLLCCFFVFFFFFACSVLSSTMDCIHAGAPVLLNTTLKFCSSSGSTSSSSCCDAAADAALSTQFDAMNVSDAACAAVLKSILCAVISDHPSSFLLFYF